MKKYETYFNKHKFVIYDYEDGYKPEIYYEKDNVLYNEGDGFPNVGVITAYLYVCENYETLIPHYSLGDDDAK